MGGRRDTTRRSGYSFGAEDDIAWVLVGLGEVAYERSDLVQALALLQESLALFRGLGNRNGLAYTFCGLGRVALARGDSAQAAALFAESSTLFGRVLSVKQGSADCLRGLSGVAVAQGQHAHAARLLGAAEALHEPSGRPL